MIFLLAPALLLFSSVRLGDTCKTGRDKLTGRTVFLTYDVEPEYEGGIAALSRSLSKIVSYPDSLISGEIDTRYSVSFIVEANGKISAGRAIHGSSKQIGNQILKAVKSCRWHPGKCNGKNVPTLYTYSTIIELREN
jgi:hypothetical protein